MPRREVALGSKWSWFAGFFVGGLVLDQVSKEWVVRNIDHATREEIPLIDGWLSFVHAHNTGAAFSMLEGMHYLFLVITLIAIGVVVHMLRDLPTQERFQSSVLGLILSGAVGNAFDRLRFGWVTDFIKVYTEHPTLKPYLIETVGTNVYPIFNVADASLLVGVFVFLFQSLRADEPEDSPEEHALIGDVAAEPSVED